MDYGSQSMVGKIKSIVIKHPRDAFISQENLDENAAKYNYIGVPDYEKTLEEYAEFEKIIRDNVENVYYLPRDERAGLDSVYAHDTVKITEKGAIILNMGKEVRRGETGATKDFLQSIGVPILGEITGEGRVEGGDVLWLDERTIAIGRSYRTNDEGIRQMKELTKDVVDEFIVVDLPHANGEEEILHLMSLISLVDKDLAVVYSKYMAIFFREMLLERGIQLIEVPDDEYDYLGANVLPLEPRKCVMLKGSPKTKKMLEDAGAEVLEYSGHEVSYKGMGGATCFTMPLYRL